jgi:hypothetical protein
MTRAELSQRIQLALRNRDWQIALFGRRRKLLKVVFERRPRLLKFLFWIGLGQNL